MMALGDSKATDGILSLKYCCISLECPRPAKGYMTYLLDKNIQQVVY